MSKVLKYTSLAQYILVFMLALLLYLPSLKNKFALDDLMMINQNQFTKSGWEGMRKIFTNDSFTGFFGEEKALLPGGRYRPLSQAVFNLMYSSYADDPFPYHLINIIFYSISMVVALAFLNQLFQPKSFISIPLIAVLLYVFHPLNSEVVANIKSLDLILAGLFGFLSLFAVIKFMDTSKIFYLVLALVTVFLALLSKETIITFSPLVILFWLFFRRDKTRLALIGFGGFVLVSVFYLFLRWSIIGNSNDVVVSELLNDPFLQAVGNQKLATIFYTWFVYLKLMFLPIDLTHDYYPYVIELVSFKNATVIFIVFFLLSSIFYSLWHIWLLITKKIKPNILVFGFLFLSIVFSVSSNLFINIGAFMNERFLYIALLGFTVIIAKLLFDISALTKSKNINVVVTLLSFAILIPYSVKTVAREKVWFNDFKLFTTDVEISKNSAKCNVSAGGEYLKLASKTTDAGRRELLLQKANLLISKGVKIHPLYLQGWILLGNSYFDMGNLHSAKDCYSNALKISPDNSFALNNIYNTGNKAQIKKDYNLSSEIFTICIKSKYKEYESTVYLASDIANLGNPKKATLMLDSLVNIYPDKYMAYNKLGEFYGRYFNQLEKAEEYLTKAYSINKTDPVLLENLGVLYGFKSNHKKALEFLLKAHEFNKTSKELRMNILRCYLKMGDEQNAAKWNY